MRKAMSVLRKHGKLSTRNLSNAAVTLFALFAVRRTAYRAIGLGHAGARQYPIQDGQLLIV